MWGAQTIVAGACEKGKKSHACRARFSGGWETEGRQGHGWLQIDGQGGRVKHTEDSAEKQMMDDGRSKGKEVV